MIELMSDEGQRWNVNAGASPIEYDTALKVGGQVKLEGAAGFGPGPCWDAILFVFVAVWYAAHIFRKGTHDEDESHGDALLADA